MFVLYLFNLFVLILEFVQLVGQMTVAFAHRICRTFIPKAKKSVAGEIVLITGAGKGLGRELSLRFAKLGATVVIWDINKVSTLCPFVQTTCISTVLTVDTLNVRIVVRPLRWIFDVLVVDVTAMKWM